MRGFYVSLVIDFRYQSFEATLKEAVSAKRLSVNTMKDVTNIAIKNMEVRCSGSCIHTLSHLFPPLLPE